MNASFENIDGIVVGSKVKLSGVDIGTVKNISIDPENFYASVLMSFDREFSFPDDTEASAIGGSIGWQLYINSPGGSDVMLLNNQEILYTQGSTSLLNLMLNSQTLAIRDFQLVTLFRQC